VTGALWGWPPSPGGTLGAKFSMAKGLGFLRSGGLLRSRNTKARRVAVLNILLLLNCRRCVKRSAVERCAIRPVEAAWEASQGISGYYEKTAGDDGVRGEGAWALAPMHPLRSPHGARSDHALQILPWPGASAQRIEPRSPSPHRTPAKTPRLPIPGWHVQRSRIGTSPRVEIRRSAIEVVATGDYAKCAYGQLWTGDDKPASGY